MVRTLHINVSEEKVLAMMQAADLDDNGEVDFEEVRPRHPGGTR